MKTKGCFVLLCQWCKTFSNPTGDMLIKSVLKGSPNDPASHQLLESVWMKGKGVRDVGHPGHVCGGTNTPGETLPVACQEPPLVWRLESDTECGTWNTHWTLALSYPSVQMTQDI